MSYCLPKHSGFLTGISAAPCRSLPIQQLEGWEIIIWILSSKGFQFQRTKSKLPLWLIMPYDRTSAISSSPTCSSPAAIPQRDQLVPAPGPLHVSLPEPGMPFYRIFKRLTLVIRG